MKFSKIIPAIRQAGQIALGYYQQVQLERRHKSDLSPVSAADLAVEKFLFSQIETLYADYAQDYEVIGEEYGGKTEGREFAWLIDPIDGTRVFLDGLPLWSISVGLLRHQEIYRGAVYLPVLNELYLTDDDGVALWNDQPLAGMMLDQPHLDSFIGSSASWHRNFTVDFPRIRALGSTALQHVLVARGGAVAALHRKFDAWDVAGAHAILSAVGGEGRYLDGTLLSMSQLLNNPTRTPGLLVGHPAVVADLIPKIRPLR